MCQPNEKHCLIGEIGERHCQFCNFAEGLEEETDEDTDEDNYDPDFEKIVEDYYIGLGKLPRESSFGNN